MPSLFTALTSAPLTMRNSTRQRLPASWHHRFSVFGHAVEHVGRLHVELDPCLDIGLQGRNGMNSAFDVCTDAFIGECHGRQYADKCVGESE